MLLLSVSSFASMATAVVLRARFGRCQMRMARATSTKVDNIKVVCDLSSNGALQLQLNRPEALNALDEDMTLAIKEHLSASPQRVCVVSSTSGRALCAGGDIKALRSAVQARPYPSLLPPSGHKVHRVFQAEYSLVTQVGTRAAPFVTLIKGVWMGFGVGATVFGSHRVVTDSVTFAMPECAIGLWPDVGFALAAARCPGALGLHLALTGARLTSAQDLLHAGLATHYVPEDSWQALSQALQEQPLDDSSKDSSSSSSHPAVDALLGQFAREVPGGGQLAECQQLIDDCYGPALAYKQRGQTAAQALQLLHQRLTELQCSGQLSGGAQQLVDQALAGLQQGCPFSQAVTLAHYAAVAHDVEHAGPLSRLEQVMQREYLMAVRMASRPDFSEGVRAVVVDKDRQARWAPASWQDVSEEEVEAMAGELPAGLGLLLG